MSSSRPPTRADLAEALACDESQVSRWWKKGMPRESIEAAKKWTEENVTRKPKGEPLAPDEKARNRAAKLKYEEERAERMGHSAARAKLEVQKIRGELVPIADVQKELAAVADLYSAHEMQDAKEAGKRYSDKSVAEIDVIAIPHAAEKIRIFVEALRKIGKKGAAEVARQAKKEKGYGVDS